MVTLAAGHTIPYSRCECMCSVWSPLDSYSLPGIPRRSRKQLVVRGSTTRIRPSKAIDDCLYQRASSGVNGMPHLPGTNSKNIIESTGTFPPAAVPITAQRALNDTKFSAPPAAHKKIPAINRVQLNAGRRPIKSLEMPQNEAPTISPV